VPAREFAERFGATEYFTVPLPVPEAPEVMVMKLVLLTAVHEAVCDVEITFTLPGPPLAVALAEDALKLNGLLTVRYTGTVMDTPAFPCGIETICPVYITPAANVGVDTTEAVTFVGVPAQHPSPKFVDSQAPPFPEDVSTIKEILVPEPATGSIWLAGFEPSNVMEKLRGADSTKMLVPT